MPTTPETSADPTPPRLPAMLGPGFAYGADYNPEQWDDAVLADDIRLMQEAGVTVATLAVFSWSLLEPTPGEFDTGWLRRVMDALHEAGIGVDLATGTASPPAWLGREHPSTLPVMPDGRTLWWGSRQQYNPSSAIFRERVRLLVERMARDFADHPALVAWHVGNEYACHVWESVDEESAERFREWLRRRYGSLAEVNRVWGAAFWSQRLATREDVIPPRPTPTFQNPHRLTDWRSFCSDTLLELYLLERDILRAANPAIPITTNFMGLFGPVDYWEWARHVDFVSNDSYPDPSDPRGARTFAFECDLMRSLGQGRPWIQMEQVTSAVQWRGRNAVKRPGQYELWSLGAVARGADGILTFQWRQSIAGAETWHGAMVNHSGASSRTWAEVVSLGATLDALADVRGTQVQARVAILWDWRSAWAQEDALGPTDDRAAHDGVRAWHASLFERGHLVDIAHPGQDLTGYAVVVVPSLYRLEEAYVARLAEAVRAGAQVVVTHLTGHVDADGHAVLGGYAGALSDVLGVHVVDLSPRAVEIEPLVPSRVGGPAGPAEPLDPSVDRISAAVGTPGAERGIALRDTAGEPWPGGGVGWAEVVHLDDSDDSGSDVEVVATFDCTDLCGEPAITVRPLMAGRGAGQGAGAGWYVGTDLDARGRDRLLDLVLERAGIAEVALPAGVERRERGGVTFWPTTATRPCTSPTSRGSTRAPVSPSRGSSWHRGPAPWCAERARTRERADTPVITSVSARSSARSRRVRPTAQCGSVRAADGHELEPGRVVGGDVESPRRADAAVGRRHARSIRRRRALYDRIDLDDLAVDPHLDGHVRQVDRTLRRVQGAARGPDDARRRQLVLTGNQRPRVAAEQRVELGRAGHDDPIVLDRKPSREGEAAGDEVGVRVRRVGRHALLADPAQVPRAARILGELRCIAGVPEVEPLEAGGDEGRPRRILRARLEVADDRDDIVEAALELRREHEHRPAVDERELRALPDVRRVLRREVGEAREPPTLVDPVVEVVARVEQHDRRPVGQPGPVQRPAPPAEGEEERVAHLRHPVALRRRRDDPRVRPRVERRGG